MTPLTCDDDGTETMSITKSWEVVEGAGEPLERSVAIEGTLRAAFEELASKLESEDLRLRTEGGG